MSVKREQVVRQIVMLEAELAAIPKGTVAHRRQTAALRALRRRRDEGSLSRWEAEMDTWDDLDEIQAESAAEESERREHELRRWRSVEDPDAVTPNAPNILTREPVGSPTVGSGRVSPRRKR